jgi:hypothetical protein
MNYLDYSKLPAFVRAHYSQLLPQLQSGDAPLGAGDYIDVVRFFGDEAVDPGEVAVEYRDDPFAIADPLIASYADEIAERMRAEGRLYQGPPVMKLVATHLASGAKRLIVQPCDYAIQAGTCLALDVKDDRFAQHGGTLRGYYRHGCEQPSIENNPLAICLGVCGYLLVEEQGRRFLLQIERSEKLASLEGERGPSVAGVVDYRTDFADLTQLIRKSLTTEIGEEINLRYGEYDIIPLGWAIELFRGERPQLFCLIRAPFERKELSARLDAVDPARREFKSYEFLPLYGGAVLDKKQFEQLNFEARMNFLLLEEYLALHRVM